MAHWDWQTISAVATLAVLLLGLAWRGYRRLADQNEEQLRRQRRINRELFGEDPDNPNGPKSPSVREMISQVIDQTRPLQDTVAEHGRRLGKVEDVQANLDTRVTSLDTRVTALERTGLRDLTA